MLFLLSSVWVVDVVPTFAATVTAEAFVLGCVSETKPKRGPMEFEGELLLSMPMHAEASSTRQMIVLPLSINAENATNAN